MLREVLNNLSPSDREQLMYAFEQELAQFVVLADGHFIGVHLTPLKNLTVLETAGVWSYGTVQ